MYENDAEDMTRFITADHREANIAPEEEVIAGIHAGLHIENEEVEGGAQNQDSIKDQADSNFEGVTNQSVVGSATDNGNKEISRQVSVDSSTQVNALNAQKRYQHSNEATNRTRNHILGHPNTKQHDPRVDYEEIRGRSRKSSSSSDRGSSSHLAKDWGWFEDVHFGETDGKVDDSPKKDSKDGMVKLSPSVKGIEGPTKGQQKKLKLFFDNMGVNDVDEVVPKKGMHSLIFPIAQ